MQRLLVVCWRSRAFSQPPIARELRHAPYVSHDPARLAVVTGTVSPEWGHRRAAAFAHVRSGPRGAGLLLRRRVGRRSLGVSLIA